MQTDFYDAFYRHLTDAEYLYTKNRWANADQLYGYAAECGLKCLMWQFGMSVDAVSGDPAEKDNRTHINKIWVRYEIYRARRGAAGYTLTQTNPFDDWNVSQRYAHESNFDQLRVDSHKNGAEIVRVLLRKAILEGMII
jgi:hypothetical protein